MGIYSPFSLTLISRGPNQLNKFNCKYLVLNSSANLYRMLPSANSHLIGINLSFRGLLRL